MRVILFTGKGGVGKTSISAATALMGAKQGLKTLVISTDPAHSLADSLDIPLTGEPKEIHKNLWAEEINPQQKIEENYSAVKDYLTLLFSSQEVDEVVAEELAVFPGLDELFSLIEIKTQAENKKFDFLVIDCAPTGATLRLLSFPDIASWYMKKIFPLERKVAKMVKPLVNRIAGTPFIPKDEFYDTIQNIYGQAGIVRDILGNPKISSVRLVMNPEKMVIKEAQRAYTYLNLFGFPVDGCIVNRVMPEEIHDPYFVEWKGLQKQYLELIHEAFQPLPILKASLYKKEIVGFEMLEKLGEEIYKGIDPVDVLHTERPFEIKKSGKQYTLLLKIPFLQKNASKDGDENLIHMSKQDVDLTQKGDELIIKVGWFKHNISLPDAMSTLSVKEAKVIEEGMLSIKFG